MAYAVSGDDMSPLASYKDGLTLQQALDRWLEEANPSSKSAIPMIWEPTGDHAMAHDRIEVPRVTRAGFATLEEVGKKYQGIATSTNAWGFEPLPKGVMSGKVFLHVETVPVIQVFGETCVSQGLPIGAVWAIPSVAFNGFGRGIGVKVLAVAPGFCGIYTLPYQGGPTRGVVSVFDTSDPQASRGIYPALETAGFFTSDTAPRGWKVVGAKDDLQALVPILAETDPQVEGFMQKAVNQVQMKSWASFVEEGTRRLPRGGEQDLWATFPQPFPLGSVFRWAAGVLGLIALIFACAAAHTNHLTAVAAVQNRTTEQTISNDLEAARTDLALFSDLKAKATGRESVNAKAFPRGRAALLKVLTESVPEEFTLTSLTIGADGAVGIEFFQVIDGPDLPDSLLNLKNELQREGLGNCQIQLVTTPPDPEAAGPSFGLKRHYHLTAMYAAPAGL
jgi:hypothetical protein